MASFPIESDDSDVGSSEDIDTFHDDGNDDTHQQTVDGDITISDLDPSTNASPEVTETTDGDLQIVEEEDDIESHEGIANVS